MKITNIFSNVEWVHYKPREGTWLETNQGHDPWPACHLWTIPIVSVKAKDSAAKDQTQALSCPVAVGVWVFLPSIVWLPL